MASSSTSVTPNMVERLWISDLCYHTAPCQHDCTIQLTDGRKIEKKLIQPDIVKLVKAINPEKIICSEGLDHFQQEGLSVLQCLREAEAKQRAKNTASSSETAPLKTADTILTYLFQRSIAR